MVPWPQGPWEMGRIRPERCCSVLVINSMWCDVLHSAWTQNVILVCFIYSFSLSLKMNLCLLWRPAELEKKYRKETEVVSGMSQLGITVKARLGGGLRKGICNFPPLISPAVWNSYLSPLSFGLFCLFPFFTLVFLFSLSLMSKYSPILSACFVIDCVVYSCTWDNTNDLYFSDC